MLLHNQRKAIETYVTAGTMLPPDLSGALSAALSESESSCSALRLQLAEVRGENAKLLNERDQMLQVKKDLQSERLQLDVEVETRVNLRTEDLRKQLNRVLLEHSIEANAREQAKAVRDQLELRLQKSNYELRQLLDKFERLIREQSSGKLLRKLFFKKTARECLLEYDAFELRERDRMLRRDFAPQTPPVTCG